MTKFSELKVYGVYLTSYIYTVCFRAIIVILGCSYWIERVFLFCTRYLFVTFLFLTKQFSGPSHFSPHFYFIVKPLVKSVSSNGWSGWPASNVNTRSWIAVFFLLFFLVFFPAYEPHQWHEFFLKLCDIPEINPGIHTPIHSRWR